MQKFEIILDKDEEKRPKQKKHQNKCQCHNCKQSRKFNRYIKKSKMGPIKTKFFNDLYDELVNTRLDRDWNEYKLEKFYKALGEKKYTEIYNEENKETGVY